MPRAKIFPFHNNFTAGLISPIVQARTGMRFYQNGLRQAKNVIIFPHGGAGRRGGFVKSAISASQTESDNVRIIPFIFSNNPKQSYILEFSPNKIRFFYGYNHSQVLNDDDSIYEITTSPYTSSDIPNLRYRQSADVLYLVDGNHKPRELIRKTDASGNTTWTLQAINDVGKPFEPENEVFYDLFTFRNEYWNQNTELGIYDSNQIKFYFESQGANITRLSTGIASLSETDGINYDYSGPFDNDYPPNVQNSLDSASIIDNNWSWRIEGRIYLPQSGTWDFGFNAAEWGDLSFDADAEIICKQYGQEVNGQPPSNQDAFMNDGEVIRNAQVTDLDEGEHWFQCRTVVIHANTGTLQLGYRWDGDVNNDNASNSSGLLLPHRGNSSAATNDGDSREPDELEYYGPRCFQIKITIGAGDTFSWAYREIADFDDTGDVLHDTNNSWREVLSGIDLTPHVTSDNAYVLQDPTAGKYISNVLAAIQFESGGTYTDGDYFTFKVGYLNIPAKTYRNTEFSQESSYPKLVEIHQNRLWFANFSGRPNTVMASKVGNYRNFRINPENLHADDALEFSITSGKVDEIVWLSSGRKLIIGTVGSEYVVGSDGPAVAPDDIESVANSFYGGSFVEPVRVGNDILFVEVSDVRLRDYYYSFDIDGYDGDNQSILSYEEIKDGIKEMAFQQAGQCVYITDGSSPWYSNYSNLNVPAIDLVWVVTNNGELKGITFEKKQKVIAWHEHSIGTDYSEVESVAVIPGPDGRDVLWAVINYGGLRYIGYLSNTIPVDNWDASSETGNYFEADIETLPFDRGEGSESLVMHRKRFVYAGAELLAGWYVYITKGPLDSDNSPYQLLEEVTNGPETKKINLMGWDREATILVKSAIYANSVSFPMVLLGLFGEMHINE